MLHYGKYRLNLSIGYVGVEQEDEVNVADSYTKDEWYALTEEEKEKFLYEECEETVGQSIEYSWKLMK